MRISIHASHAGRDLPESELINIKWNFNPRVPCGTRRELRALEGFDFPISIHASHAGRDVFSTDRCIHINISIHASHAGRDPQKWVTGLDEDAISIHASHAGRDILFHIILYPTCLFQSTRPMRDATPTNSLSVISLQFQSTRPMRDATARNVWIERLSMTFQSTRPMRDATQKVGRVVQVANISIHASHAGRDHRQISANIGNNTFQSTRPMRDATLKTLKVLPNVVISIHASHAGRDLEDAEWSAIIQISIHASHAGRDCGAALVYRFFDISIHASHAGRDVSIKKTYIELVFQSTRPMRDATCIHSGTQQAHHISIHASHAGRDSFVSAYLIASIIISIHASPAGHDL